MDPEKGISPLSPYIRSIFSTPKMDPAGFSESWALSFRFHNVASKTLVIIIVTALRAANDTVKLGQACPTRCPRAPWRP
jgi:hypothetical protein